VTNYHCTINDPFYAGFTQIDHNILSLLLQRDTLRVKETKLFDAVVKWSSAECGRRRIPVTPEEQRLIVGHAVDLIRFPLMSVEEFSKTAGFLLSLSKS
jgi:BTB/POZ domain-containing protein 1/2